MKEGQIKQGRNKHQKKQEEEQANNLIKSKKYKYKNVKN